MLGVNFTWAFDARSRASTTSISTVHHRKLEDEKVSTGAPSLSIHPSVTPSLSPSDSSNQSPQPSMIKTQPTQPVATSSPVVQSSSAPSFTKSHSPTSSPSTLPSSLPSAILSAAPSPSPSFGYTVITSQRLEMIFDGLNEDDFQGSRAQDHWREKTSAYIQNQWNQENNNSTFVFSEVVTYIERIGSTTRRVLRIPGRDLSRVRIRRGTETKLRVIYWYDFTIRGSKKTKVPDEIYSMPFSQDYIEGLKNDDPTRNSIFMDVESVESSVLVEPTTSMPTITVSNPPSSSPTIQLYNGDSEDIEIATIVMIMGASIMGIFSLGAMIKSFVQYRKR